MISKLLIANRGEIACRIIASARASGVATVAVYSDADAGARHVAMADEAVHIGPPPVADSYLMGDRIIAAALKTGAQAIHPGYGFLSENPDFVKKVEDAGLIFVGPPASAIKAMGLKDAAKALMEEAGVPVVPGYHGDNQDPAFLAAEAEKIGYPVLIKARAGGGGKGMRLVEAPASFAAALDSARREATAAFGDPACLVEKFIQNPRHIEIQVFADAHGNVVHLFERDCSLQRRHQKVIEEAPAPGMNEETRAAMGAAAVEAARSIGYQGAGTVEFIVDGSGELSPDKFWFMEMNTRLQVEHPVSEAITGLDFVRLQLQVASGAPLPFAQDDLTIDGHAFEARIYAEDAANDFLPATGTLDHLRFPEAEDFALAPVRVDSGVREGDVITPHYDPMIAKLIVHAPTRGEALAALRRALAQVHVAGSVTNLAFLGALAGHEGFGKGEVDTGLIARDYDALTATGETPPTVTALAAIAALGLLDPAPAGNPWAQKNGFALWSQRSHTATFHKGDEVNALRVTIDAPQQFTVTSGETAPRTLTIRPAPDGGLHVTTGDAAARYHITRKGQSLTIFADGHAYGFTIPDPLAGQADAGAGGDAVTSPMPGLVKVIHASAGATVSKGDPLMVLEAMKMEHTLTAPRDGTLAEILANAGDQVDGGAVLALMEPA